MRFDFALIFSFLLASAVLAGRHREHRQTHPPIHVEKSTHGTPVQSENWSGAVLDGSFDAISGTFVVPVPSGQSNSAASAWVGIDGHTCENAVLQTGVDFIVDNNNNPYYQAWWEWYPDQAYDFDISISAGDVIRAAVGTLSATKGIAMIENLTTKQSAMQHIQSTSALCRKNAEWIVGNYLHDGNYVTFANFSTVTFTDTDASGASGTYTLDGANTWAIVQNGQTLTSTSIHGSSITISYV